MSQGDQNEAAYQVNIGREQREVMSDAIVAQFVRDCAA